MTEQIKLPLGSRNFARVADKAGVTPGGVRGRDSQAEKIRAARHNTRVLAGVPDFRISAKKTARSASRSPTGRRTFRARISCRRSRGRRETWKNLRPRHPRGKPVNPTLPDASGQYGAKPGNRPSSPLGPGMRRHQGSQVSAGALLRSGARRAAIPSQASARASERRGTRTSWQAAHRRSRSPRACPHDREFTGTGHGPQQMARAPHSSRPAWHCCGVRREAFPLRVHTSCGRISCRQFRAPQGKPITPPACALP